MLYLYSIILLPPSAVVTLVGSLVGPLDTVKAYIVQL